MKAAKENESPRWSNENQGRDQRGESSGSGSAFEMVEKEGMKKEIMDGSLDAASEKDKVMKSEP